MVPDRIEWPTVGVALAIAGGFGAVLVVHDQLPAVTTITLLAVLGAWYNSLQHEVIHGHPTPWRTVNTALAAAPLGLAVPFGLYRDIHLAHHRSSDLTDPRLDPESFHVTPEAWARAGRAHRVLLLALRTLAGRMVLGPLVAAGRWARTGIAAMRTPAGLAREVGHIGAIVVMAVVLRAVGLPLWIYVVGTAWGGGALSMMRSFAEHRLVEEGTRSAVVRSGPFFSVLYLNNNLHHTHHERPGLPWFALPAAHLELESDQVADDGAGLYAGYGDVARRFLVRPFGTPVR